MQERIYITTSIPYVNAKPHIGHALELVQADATARFHRLEGRQTVFQTGTDENAFKNVLAAREQGVTTEELVDRNARIFRDLVGALDISADTFIRTTESRHRRGVRLLCAITSYELSLPLGMVIFRKYIRKDGTTPIWPMAWAIWPPASLSSGRKQEGYPSACRIAPRLPRVLPKR